MTVKVTLRYLYKSLIYRTTEEIISEGCSAGELAARLVRAEEDKEDIQFSGASIVILINGQVATPDHLLEDGDEIKIFPVAAAG